MGMLSNHRFLFIGNVAKEPVLSVVANGKVLGKMTICVNEKWVDKDTGEQKHKALYFNISCFDGLTCKKMEALKQGAFIVLEGDIVPNKFKDKNGNDVYVTNFMATGLSSPNFTNRPKTTAEKMPVEPPPFATQDDDLPLDKPSKPKNAYDVAEDIFSELDI